MITGFCIGALATRVGVAVGTGVVFVTGVGGDAGTTMVSNVGTSVDLNVATLWGVLVGSGG